MLDVHPNEDVLDGLGEEEPTRITRGRNIELVQEEELPKVEEEDKRGTRQTINDGRYDRVGDCWV